MPTKTSDYITIKETAEAWGVSRRYVNMCITDGRVPGAVRAGNMWLVPKGADKPIGTSREKKKAPEKSMSSELAYILGTLPMSSPPQNLDGIPDTIRDERLRLITEAGIAYMRGDYERTKRCFHQLGGDGAAKLCTCTAAIAAAISTGDYPLFTEIEAYLKGVVQANISRDVTAYAEMALAAGYLGAIAPSMVPSWIKEGDFAALPPEIRPDAAHKRAQYFQSNCQYESMLVVAQTALAFCDSEREISGTSLYLRLMCAAALYSLDRIDEAKRSLLDAMRVYLPVGFITPFAELILAFCGLMEQCLEQDFPAYHDAVIEQWKRVIPNWHTFHNRFTEDNIILMMPRRDYEIAVLAASGVPYARIARQFNISVGRLNNIMREICEKLYISGRKELANLVLQAKK